MEREEESRARAVAHQRRHPPDEAVGLTAQAGLHDTGILRRKRWTGFESGAVLLRRVCRASARRARVAIQLLFALCELYEVR